MELTTLNQSRSDVQIVAAKKVPFSDLLRTPSKEFQQYQEWYEVASILITALNTLDEKSQKQFIFFILNFLTKATSIYNPGRQCRQVSLIQSPYEGYWRDYTSGNLTLENISKLLKNHLGLVDSDPDFTIFLLNETKFEDHLSEIGHYFLYDNPTQLQEDIATSLQNLLSEKHPKKHFFEIRIPSSITLEKDKIEYLENIFRTIFLPLFEEERRKKPSLVIPENLIQLLEKIYFIAVTDLFKIPCLLFFEFPQLNSPDGTENPKKELLSSLIMNYGFTPTCTKRGKWLTRLMHENPTDLKKWIDRYLPQDISFSFLPIRTPIGEREILGIRDLTNMPIFHSLVTISKDESELNYFSILSKNLISLLRNLETISVEGKIPENTYQKLALLTFPRILILITEFIKNKDHILNAINIFELIYEKIFFWLTMLKSFNLSDLETEIKEKMDPILNELPSPDFSTVKVYSSGMRALTQAIDALDAVKPGTKNILTFDGIYFETTNVLNRKKFVVFSMGDDVNPALLPSSTKIDAVFIDFHQSCDTATYYYEINKISEIIQKLLSYDILADQFSLIIDLTFNTFSDPELKELITKLMPLINAGKTNIVLFRSMQKYDQLGIDKVTGGWLMAINNPLAFTAFNTALKPEKLCSAAIQALTFFYKYTDIEEYQNTIRRNTRLVYESIEEKYLYDGDDLKAAIIRSEDDRLGFIDICLGRFSADYADILLERLSFFKNCTLINGRDSFGFVNTTAIKITPNKIRLSIGLMTSEQLTALKSIITKFLDQFNILLSILKTEAYSFMSIEDLKTCAKDILIMFLYHNDDDYSWESIIYAQLGLKFESKNILKSIIYYQQALTLCPHNLLAIKRMGDLYFYRGQITDAKMIYEMAEPYFFKNKNLELQLEIQKNIVECQNILSRTPS